MRNTKTWVVILLAGLLVACGGSSSDSGSAASSSASSSSSSSAPGTVSAVENEPTISVAGAAVNPQQAARFLTQASFGPNMASIDAITSSNIETWIAREFERTQIMHLDYVDQFPVTGVAPNVQSQNIVWESFWKRAIQGKDQLRQRMAFALSQIFVISLDNDSLSQNYRGVASYYDMLGRNAFGNFRTLLEEVSLHPSMGLYLTHIHNQKESGSRVPDENYAREVMQLFTIGLHRLNLDGTEQLVGGKPVETYTNSDVTGLAKVFTGFSWGGADKSTARFFGYNTPKDPNRDVIPMQAYPQYHSTSVKAFLGTTIATQGSADPAASLKVALDTLFNHPNVGPFIGKQLIQRLVTSNPSPAYVARVASAFNNNGSGVRGDMKSVIRAILLDTEARSATSAQGNNYGKLREPVIRLANWARAFGAGSSSTRFAIGDTSSTSALGQAPLRSPSVFNFYRPGYVPPNTSAGAAGLVVPEMQITHETTVASYINYMQGVIPNGPSASSGQTADRVIAGYTAEIALADTPSALVDRVNLLLLANGMKPATRTAIINAVSSVAIPATPASAADTARKNRVYLAIYLAMASPDYLVQK